MFNEMEEMSEIEEDTQKNRFLTFSLEAETYGIEISCVTEIVKIQPITEVPELPEYMKGIINLRGKIIPTMDIRLRFKKEPKPYNDRTCVIIIDMNDLNIGLIVDNVSEVVSIEESNIVAPPLVSCNFNNKYIKNIGKIGKEIKLLLDCEKLTRDDELEVIRKAV